MARVPRTLLQPLVRQLQSPRKMVEDRQHRMDRDLPGLGWSSPIVAGKSVFLTTVTTDGKAKQPQVGSNYSNDYIAELQKQGLKGKELRIA